MPLDEKLAFLANDIVNVNGTHYPVSQRFIVRKTGTFPISNKFVIGVEEQPPENALIFEFYKPRPINPVDYYQAFPSGVPTNNIESAATFDQIKYDIDVFQSTQINVLEFQNVGWQWNPLPMSQYLFVDKFMRTDTGLKQWMPVYPYFDTDVSGELQNSSIPTMSTIYNTPGIPTDGLPWNPLPIDFPFPHHYMKSDIYGQFTDDGVREQTHAWWYHTYYWDAQYNPLPPMPDYVFWIRGISNTSWSSEFRNAPISDAVFSPGTRSSWRRLSLNWWNRPWLRYPNL